MLTQADKMELRSKVIEALEEHNPTAEVLNQKQADSLVRCFDEFCDLKYKDESESAPYLVRFDPRWIECLRIMKKTGSPMTTNEIAEMMGGDRLYRKQVVRYFVYARHWKLIEKTGERFKGSDLYRLTPECIACIDKDSLTVQGHIWTKKGMRVNPPVGERDGDYIRVLPA